MAKTRRSGLGKGLDVLFADNATEESNSSTLPLEQIEPNRMQPRRDFRPEELAELVQSITQHGILQPLVVRPVGEDRYQIVAGERRYRAAKQIGLQQLPVVIKELSDQEAMEIALIENLIRADLTPIEEAEGFKTLMEQYHLTQEEIAKRVGRSRPAVTNAMRLLSLPREVIVMIESGKISAGHGRALLGLEGEKSVAVAVQVVKRGLNVRQTEELVKQLNKPVREKVVKVGSDTAIYKEIELSLGEYLGRKVKVVGSSQGKGKITLSFHSRDELKEFARALGQVDQQEE